MTDDWKNRDARDLWMRLWSPWASFAPRDLSQPINSGWSFGNVIVNQRNSSAPETEQAILAEESYGRQIGKLLEAVHELIKEKPGSAANPAFQDIEALREKVDRLKREAATARIDQLRRDLELLRASDKEAFKSRIEALRSLLPLDER
ncbi:MAG: hypothetical protein AB7F22_00940 [Reyranella sp.]|uniref:hypothetical protein n=1 Tax=Reyranella sp. TaxID=1929291 RepID=UPI003D0A88D7